MAQQEHRGGLWAQLLEMFGMTPTVQSGPSGARGVEQRERELPPLSPLCKSCHNSARWDESQNRWRCPHHPHASLIEQESPDQKEE